MEGLAELGTRMRVGIMLVLQTLQSLCILSIPGGRESSDSTCRMQGCWSVATGSHQSW